MNTRELLLVFEEITPSVDFSIKSLSHRLAPFKIITYGNIITFLSPLRIIVNQLIISVSDV